MDRGLLQGRGLCMQERNSLSNHRGSPEQPFQASLPALFKRAPAEMMGKGCGGWCSSTSARDQATYNILEHVEQCGTATQSRLERWA